MTAAELTASAAGEPESPRSPRRQDRTWWVTAVAGALQLGGLAIVLAGGSPVVLAALTAAVGVLLGGCALAPRALVAVRRNRGWIVFVAALLAAGWWVTATIERIASTHLDTGIISVPGAPIFAIRATVP